MEFVFDKRNEKLFPLISELIFTKKQQDANLPSVFIASSVSHYALFFYDGQYQTLNPKYPIFYFEEVFTTKIQQINEV